MSDFDEEYSFTKYEILPDTYIIEINAETQTQYFLTQGNLDQEITITRKIENLMEPEAEKLQPKILEIQQLQI